MSSELSSKPHAPVSAWRRFLAWVQAFEEAMDTSYDEIQDRRILALERKVASLRSRTPPDQISTDPGGVPPAAES
jgi:hypothetical protein